MHTVVLDNETDFIGWRDAARALVLADIPPENVTWAVAGREPELFEPSNMPAPVAADKTFNVPSGFIDLTGAAIFNRHPERFALLYRLLWRLRKTPLLMTTIDADVAAIQTFAKEVRRDEHKMHAFVRFREFRSADSSRFVAWFEPAHYIVELAAPHFERRFANMTWSILTPDRCAHWNGSRTIFTPGAMKTDAPSDDPLESIWRSYYARIFNPARLKIKAMQAEMPKRYWRNLPEASLINSLIAKAGQETQAMIDSGASFSNRSRQRKEEEQMALSSELAKPHGLAALREEAANCRACHLWKNATQTVFGEGAAHASAMFIGEQPGDKEDLAGKPFVGPAGQMLDRGLKDAGIERSTIYITNAVKHFKFEPRGKIRLHQKPNTPEIKACHQWYERELAAIQPALVVAMGATAAQSVFGKITPIGKNRGRLIDLAEGIKALVTIHPSYLLRLPDEEAKQREYKQFVSDLKLAATYLHKIENYR
ncbi:MAG TPA: UdgX family uracil-DNA binding protein [Afipia sp.]